MLVGVGWRHDGWDLESSLEELARLAETAGIEVVGLVTQNLQHPNRAHYVGSGKLQEIVAMRDEIPHDVIITNDELSPAQLRNLEEALQIKVVDRTALILDIFAQRAQTKEGRLQVELAQLEYRLPRLTRMWTHLSRQTVGGVGLRGPGETQLESDRREVRRKIAWIKEQLTEVHRHRQLYRDRRRRQNAPVVSLVGYTNAGKSTLLNALAGSSVLAEDRLFATLDPTTRRVGLPSGKEVLVTDTVGFINNLPTFLVAAFRATLEEILEATLLVHVIDVTHPKAAEQVKTVEAVLEDLGADSRPVILALNKVDQLVPGEIPAFVLSGLDREKDFVLVSAQTGQGLTELLERIENVLADFGRFVDVEALIPYTESRLVALFHRAGEIANESFREEGTVLSGRLPRGLVRRFEPYLHSNGRER